MYTDLQLTIRRYSPAQSSPSGRRPILTISFAGQRFCFAMTAILLSVGTKSAAYGAVAMISLFQVAIELGIPIVGGFRAVLLFSLR